MAVFAAGVRSRGSLLALLLATSVAGLLAVAFLAGPAGAAVAVDHVMITFRKNRGDSNPIQLQFENIVIYNDLGEIDTTTMMRMNPDGTDPSPDHGFEIFPHAEYTGASNLAQWSVTSTMGDFDFGGFGFSTGNMRSRDPISWTVSISHDEGGIGPNSQQPTSGGTYGWIVVDEYDDYPVTEAGSVLQGAFSKRIIEVQPTAGGTPGDSITISGSFLFNLICSDLEIDGVPLAGGGSFSPDGRVLSGCGLPQGIGGGAIRAIDFANPCMLPTCVSPSYGYKVDTVVTAVSSPLGANEGNQIVEITVTGTGLLGVGCADFFVNSNPFSGLEMYDGTAISGCNAPSVGSGVYNLTLVHGLDTVVVEDFTIRPVFDAVSVITPGVSDALQILGFHLHGVTCGDIATTEPGIFLVSQGETVDGGGTSMGPCSIPPELPGNVMTPLTLTYNGLTADNSPTVTPRTEMTAITPNTGRAGESVVFTGSNFVEDTACGAFALNGEPFTGTATIAGDKLSVTGCAVPGGIETGTSTALEYSYSLGGSPPSFTALPHLDGIAPTNGPAGTLVSISGTNLVGTTCAEYTVGGVPLEGGAGTVSMDGTTITGCTIAANSDYGTDVSVIVTHNGVTNSVGIPTFTVDPELNNAFPIGGSHTAGSTLQIDGNSLSNNCVDYTLGGVTLGGVAGGCGAPPCTSVMCDLPDGLEAGVTHTLSLFGVNYATPIVILAELTDIGVSGNQDESAELTITGSSFTGAVCGDFNFDDTYAFGGTAVVTADGRTVTGCTLPTGRPHLFAATTEEYTHGSITASKTSTVVMVGAVSSSSPTSGPAGTPVTLTGSSFVDAADCNAVALSHMGSNFGFGGVATASGDRKTLTGCTIPDLGPGTYPILYAGRGLVGVSLTVTAHIASISTSPFVGGDPFTLTGSGFHDVADCNEILFGGVAAFGTIAPDAANLLGCFAPYQAHGTSGSVTLAGASTAATFSYQGRVDSHDANGNELGTITIDGHAMHDMTCSDFTIDGAGLVGVASVDANGNQVTGCSPPPGRVSGDSFSMAGTLPLSSPITFTFRPALTGISPVVGPVGTVTTISGASFGDGACSDFTLAGVSLTGTMSLSGDRLSAFGCVIPDTDAAVGTVEAITYAFGGQSALETDVIFGREPVLVSVTPGAAPATTVITISGFSLGGATCADFAIGGNILSGAGAASSSSVTGCVVPDVVASSGHDVTYSKNLVDSVGVAPSFDIEPHLDSVTVTVGVAGDVVNFEGTGLASSDCSVLSVGGVPFSAGGTPSIIGIDGCTMPVIDAAAGTYQVIATVDGLISANPVDFTYLPTLDSISPSTGAYGDSVTIVGSGFNPVDACSDFMIDTLALEGVLAVSADSITATGCTVPLGGDLGSTEIVSYTANGGHAALETDVVFTFGARVDYIVPTEGPEDTPLVIGGAGLASANCFDYLLIDLPGTPFLNGFSSTGDGGRTMSGCKIPTGLGAGVNSTIRFVMGGSDSSGYPEPSFTLEGSISAVSPTSTTGLALVDVTGTGLVDSSCTAVRFKGTTMTLVGLPSSVDTTSMTGCQVPNDLPAGDYELEISINGVTSTSSTPISILPAISSILPASAAENDAITISGTSLAGLVCSDILFDSAPAEGVANPSAAGDTVTGCSPASGPRGSHVAAVTVTIGGVTPGVGSEAFTYLPSITSLSQATADEETAIVITGSGFGIGADFSLLSCGDFDIDSVPMEGTAVEVTSDGTAVGGCRPAALSTAFSSANLRVTMGGVEASSPGVFTVVPRIDTVGPSSGNDLASLTITGVGFTGLTCAMLELSGGGRPAVALSGTASVTNAGQTLEGCEVEIDVPAGVVRDLAMTPDTVVYSNTIASAFTYEFTLASLLPAIGHEDTDLTIAGRSLHLVDCGDFALDGVGALRGTPIPNADGSAVTGCRPPAGEASGTSAALTSSGPSLADTFTYHPRVDAVVPTEGLHTQSLSVTGAGFSLLATCAELLVDGQPASGTPTVGLGGTSVSGCVPPELAAGAGYAVEANVGGFASVVSGATYNYLADITSIDPPTGDSTNQLTIHGVGFFEFACSEFLMGGAPLNGTAFVSVDGTAVTGCTPPDPAPAPGTPVTVNIAKGAQTTNDLDITYTVEIVVDTVAPLEGHQETPLVISGSGLFLLDCDNFVTPTNVTLRGSATVSADGTTLSGCRPPAIAAGSWQFALSAPGLIFAYATVAPEFDLLPSLAAVSKVSTHALDTFDVSGLGMFGASCSDVVLLGASPAATLVGGTSTASDGTSINGCAAPSDVEVGTAYTLGLTLGGLAAPEADVAFTPMPIVADVQPAAAPALALVTVTGAGFNGASCANFSLVGGYPLVGTAVSSAADTQLTGCRLPAGIDGGSSHEVVASLHGVDSSAFTGPNVVIEPHFDAITDNFGRAGDAVTITGTGLRTSSCASVRVVSTNDPLSGTPLSNDTHLIGCSFPAGLPVGVYTLSLEAGGVASAATADFTVTPYVDQVNAFVTTESSSIEIHGSGYGSNPAAILITIGLFSPCDGSTFNLINDGLIVNCAINDAPLAIGADVNVVVTVNGIPSAPGVFVNTAVPDVVNIIPTRGFQSRPVQMYIFSSSLFLDLPTLSVRFGEGPDSVTVGLAENVTYLAPSILEVYTPVTSLSGDINIYVSNDGVTFSVASATTVFTYFSDPATIGIDGEISDAVTPDWDNDPQDAFPLRVQVQDMSGNAVDESGRQLRLAIWEIGTGDVVLEMFSISDASGLAPFAGIFFSGNRGSSYSMTISEVDEAMVRAHPDVVDGDGVDGGMTAATTPAGLAGRGRGRSRASTRDVLAEHVWHNFTTVVPCAMSTLNNGAIDPTDNTSCICGLGYYAESDFSCAPCVEGTYKDFNAPGQCLPCGDSKTTARRGAVSEEECRCREGTYRVSSTTGEINSFTCVDCLADAGNCSTGEIYPNPGYWQAESSGLIVILECDPPEACSGGESNGCRRNHTGALCSVCVEGTAKRNGLCEECRESTGIRWLIFGLIGVAVVVVIAVLVRSVLIQNSSQRDAGVLTSGSAKIVINFFQVISSLGDFTTRWPSTIKLLLNATESVSSLSLDLFSISCTLQIDFYQNTVVTMLLPVLIFTLPGLFFSGEYAVRRCFGWKGTSWRETKIHLKTKYIATVVVIMFFAHLQIATAVMQIFSCRQIGDNSYLAADMSQLCHTGTDEGEQNVPTHRLFTIIGVIYGVLYCAGVPIYAVFILHKFRHRFHHKVIFHRVGFLFSGFREDKYYWEMWILIRKLAIMFIKVVLVDQALAQIYWGVWVIAVALVAHVRYSPYSKKTLSLLESISLTSTFVILMGGLAFFADELIDDERSVPGIALTVFLFAVAVLTALVGAFLVVVSFLKEHEKVGLRLCGCCPTSCITSCKRYIDKVDDFDHNNKSRALYAGMSPGELERERERMSTTWDLLVARMGHRVGHDDPLMDTLGDLVRNEAALFDAVHQMELTRGYSEDPAGLEQSPYAISGLGLIHGGSASSTTSSSSSSLSSTSSTAYGSSTTAQSGAPIGVRMYGLSQTNTGDATVATDATDASSSAPPLTFTGTGTSEPAFGSTATGLDSLGASGARLREGSSLSSSSSSSTTTITL